VVVAAFLHDREEVLLARRSPTKAIAPGKFHLPGGHVEFGEHPAQTLARELKEELAVAVRVEEPLWVFSYLWGTDHTVGIVFRTELLAARDQLRWDPNDLAECVWVPEERLGDYLPRDDHNFEAAVAGFRHLRLCQREP
jgi:8-oxo-dGTP pyrophosphatase MutT (NUDIX family)